MDTYQMVTKETTNKEQLNGWSLYNDATGGSRTILPEDNIHIRLANRGPEAVTWAQAYWYFLLNANGVGDRALTGIFRTPGDDHEYMYGYLPNRYKSQVKYMAYRNLEDWWNKISRSTQKWCSQYVLSNSSRWR